MTRSLTLLIALLLLVPAGASAATADLADPVGDPPASFDAVTDIRRVQVAQSGQTLVVAVTSVQERSPTLDLRVAPAAREETDPAVEQCDPDVETLAVAARGDQAVLTVPGIEGQLTAGAQRTGTTRSYTFSSPALARFGDLDVDPFACLEGDADGDRFYGAFAGKVLKLTETTAQAGLAAELRRRYGTSFTSARKPIVRCPAREIQAATTAEETIEPMAASALCAYRFTAGRSYRMGYASVFLNGGVPQVTRFSSQKFPATLKYCGFNGGTGGWREPPISGAGISVWAQRVPCSSARRFWRLSARTRKARGYRCVTTGRGEEFRAVRCKGRGGRVIRWESGA